MEGGSNAVSLSEVTNLRLINLMEWHLWTIIQLKFNTSFSRPLPMLLHTTMLLTCPIITQPLCPTITLHQRQPTLPLMNQCIMLLQATIMNQCTMLNHINLTTINLQVITNLLTQPTLNTQLPTIMNPRLITPLLLTTIHITTPNHT